MQSGSLTIRRSHLLIVAALGELALQQSAARVEEAYEALLEGRPIRSWSAPELVELEAIANGDRWPCSFRPDSVVSHELGQNVLRSATTAALAAR